MDLCFWILRVYWGWWMRLTSLKRKKVKDSPVKCLISAQYGRWGQGNGENTVEILK